MVPGLNIIDRCKAIHPKSIPAEPRSELEMDRLKTLAGYCRFCINQIKYGREQ